MASTPLDDGEGIESTPKARGRACTECRSIKVKCENQHSMLDGPCSRCTRLSLQCVYREKKRGRKPRHGNPFSGDGPSEIVLQHTMSPADSSQHSPNTSISQSSFVNHPNHYGDARFEQEYSSSRGQPVSPFTAISSPEVHSSRDSPHHRLQVKSGSHYTPSGLGTHVDSSSGSGSITNASVDPDRSLKLMGSTKEPHPKDAPAGAYSLANILADSRPSSPVHSAPIASMIRNSDPLDNYDTPVTSGILREEDVPELFHLYHEHLNPLIALLDPSLHTPNYVRSRSSILFTAILTVAARFARPHAWERSNALGQTLLGRALADGICSIEYVQALSLLTFWKDSRDSSSWRKVGLAIRMAYELNLHESQKDPLPSSELLARELLNKQRTWLQLVCYDMTTAMQRGKPQMIPDFHISDAYQWLFNHPEYPCNADAMLVISSSFGTVRLLCHSLFSSMTVANKAAFEPLMRHVAQLLDERIKKWVDNEENLQLNLAPISRAIINFQSLNLKLIVAELKLLNLVQPQLSATRIQTLECIKCAMDVLRYVVAELVPNGCIIYCQDALAVMCAYAGVWLFKQLPHVDEELGNEIIDLLRSVSAAGRTLSRQKGDTPSYFVQFFDHLVRNSRNQKVPDTSVHVIPAASAQATIGQQSQSSSSSQMPPPAQRSAHNFPVPELIPPLEGMDYQWTNVVNGLNDWWKNFNYLGADVKGNPSMGNPM